MSASQPIFEEQAPLCAADVVRGVTRLFYRQNLMVLAEVPLGNGRRADMVAIDASGFVTLVEIKVSVADLRGDRKWPEYLGYCDRFFWALPAGFDHELVAEPGFQPERTGLIVADRFDAAVLREPAFAPLNASRRKAALLRFARCAALRNMAALDPALRL